MEAHRTRPSPLQHLSWLSMTMMNQSGSHVCLQDVLHIPHRSYVGSVANILGFCTLCLCANAILAQSSTGCVAGVLVSAWPAKFNGHYECIMALLEDKVEQSEVYTVCCGDSRLLHQEYVNANDTQGCVFTFDMCRARLADGTTCGIYMPMHYWHQPIKSKERYYCGCQWDDIIKVDSHVKNLLQKQYGTLENLPSLMPQCGCGAKYRPWRHGESHQIVEVCVNGRKPHAPHEETWLLFVADRLPNELDDEIKKVQSDGDHFIKAWAQLSDEEILSSIRKVYPREEMQIDPLRLPGVARFPFDQWERDGKPCLDTAGWYEMFQKLAKHDMKNLQGIFDLCTTYTEHIDAEKKKATVV